jgi:Tol biopolymer transport system component
LLEPPRANHHWSLQWTPDGRALLYVQTYSDSAGIWRIPLSGDPPKKVLDVAPGRILDFAWSKDGKQFACARALANKDVVLITDFR